MSDEIRIAPSTTPSPAVRFNRAACPPAVAEFLVECGVDTERIIADWMDILMLADVDRVHAVGGAYRVESVEGVMVGGSAGVDSILAIW